MEKTLEQKLCTRVMNNVVRKSRKAIVAFDPENSSKDIIQRTSRNRKVEEIELEKIDWFALLQEFQLRRGEEVEERELFDTPQREEEIQTDAYKRCLSIFSEYRVDLFA